MRRHALFLVLIAALVIVVALMRPRPVHTERRAAPLQRTHEMPGSTEIALQDDELATSVEVSPVVAAPVVPSAKDASPSKTKKVRVALEPAIEGAIVILMRSRDYQETYQPAELRSDKDGCIAFDVLTEREWFLIYAYKPGVGHGYAHYYGRQVTEDYVRIKLNPAATLRIACKGSDGASLKNVEVTVMGEIEISSSYDLNGNYLASKRAPLPARKAETNEEGRCEFEFLNRGWTLDHGATRVPGWKFTITAAGPGGQREMKIDGLPGKEVVLVLD